MKEAVCTDTGMRLGPGEKGPEWGHPSFPAGPNGGKAE